MISGTVNTDRERVIQLEIIAADQQPVKFDAVVDTGFNGFLTLPTHALDTLGAFSAGTRRAQLADGNIVEMDLYFVNVKWGDKEREILALQAGAIPLVGMSLLWGCRVVFDAQHGGAITISAIP